MNAHSDEWITEAQLRKVAWGCLAAAGLSIVALVGGFWYNLHKMTQSRLEGEVTFQFERIAPITSYARMDVRLNGEKAYRPTILVDSTGKVSIGLSMRVMERPTGEISSRITSIDGTAVELQIDFHEAPNETTSYSISPKVMDCDSLCREFHITRSEVDSMERRVQNLASALSKIPPPRKPDTTRTGRAGTPE